MILQKSKILIYGIESNLETRERDISRGKRELESLALELVLNCSKQTVMEEEGGSRESEFSPEGV